MMVSSRTSFPSGTINDGKSTRVGTHHQELSGCIPGRCNEIDLPVCRGQEVKILHNIYTYKSEQNANNIIISHNAMLIQVEEEGDQ